MTVYQDFCEASLNEIQRQGKNSNLAQLTRAWMDQVSVYKYTYHFEALGRPVIQFPQDLFALQEIIWSVQPDLIIETGIAHGGSLIWSASWLTLLDYCVNPTECRRKVLGIDIDIRSHNLEAIKAHPMSHRIEMLEGSSTDESIIEKVYDFARSFKKILVCLDSNHTHDHVLAELNAYTPLVSPGSYCIVYDTIIEKMPPNSFPDRPWDIGNNPMTAVHDFLRENSNFSIDTEIDNKLLISNAPQGYLRRHS